MDRLREYVNSTDKQVLELALSTMLYLDRERAAAPLIRLADIENSESRRRLLRLSVEYGREDHLFVPLSAWNNDIGIQLLRREMTDWNANYSIQAERLLFLVLQSRKIDPYPEIIQSKLSALSTASVGTRARFIKDVNQNSDAHPVNPLEASQNIDLSIREGLKLALIRKVK